MEIFRRKDPPASPAEAQARFRELAYERDQVLAGLLERYSVHASIVGHDFGMKTEYGMPFGGYFFEHNPPTVVIDPAMALLDPDEVEVAVGHEGAHRYNTYSPLHPELEPVFSRHYDIKNLLQAVGFNSVFNGIEDPTINRWYNNVYPGSREPMTAIYGKVFKDGNPKLYTPEIAECEARLGFYPKFGKYTSAVIQKWFTGSWGEGHEPDVRRALEDTAETVDTMIPMTVEKTGAPESTRIEMFKKRYFHYLESVWPVVKNLVADDMEKAGFEEFKKSAEKLKESKENSSETKNGQQGNQTGNQPASQEKPEGGQNQEANGSPGSSGADKELPDEKPGRKKSPSGGAGQENKEEGSQPGKSGTQNPPRPLSSGDPDMDRLPEDLKEKIRSAAQGSRGNDDKDQSLRDIYRNLYPSQRGGFEDRGSFNLQEFEDALNRYLRSNLDPYAVPQHSERRSAHENATLTDQRRAADMQTSRDLEEYRRKNTGVWQFALEKQAENINQLTNSLRHILKPIVPEREGGYRSGIGPSLPDAMQDSARKAPNYRIFERTSLPVKRSYFFQIVADRSDSMYQYGKNHRNLEAVVLAGEVLERVRTPYEIAVFDSSFALLKKSTDRFTPESKEQTAQAILHCSGGTCDYHALDEMRARARAVRADYKIMLVTTDGDSNDKSALREAIVKCGQEGIIVVGFGLGEETGSVNSSYPNGRGLLSLDSSNGEDSFTGYFRRIMDEIIRHPQKFRYFKQ